MSRRILYVLSLMAIASPAAARDPLDQVQGTEDWGDRRKLKNRDRDSDGPSKAERRKQRELQAELEEHDEDAFRFEQERKSFLRDRATFKSIARDRGRQSTPVAASERPASSSRRKSSAASQAKTEDDALEIEARRLEERTTRDLERTEGLAPAASAPSEATRTPAPPRQVVVERTATEDDGNSRGPSPEEQQRWRAQAQEEARLRAEEQRRRDEEEARAREEEERRRNEEGARAAAKAKAAEQKAAEDLAKHLGGHLDNDGQFVDPDLK